MGSEQVTAIRLAVAALVGIAVGIEREWSGHATGPNARFAGARTFLLLGFAGGVAGCLYDVGINGPATVILSGGVLLLVAAYIMASRPGGEAMDGTTEAAALAVLGAAVIAGLGELRLAAGSGALMVLALREKGAIHRFVARIGDVEMRAGLQFAVLALVLLPLLPDGTYGPLGGIQPRRLWTFVLFLCGLNFLGYLARRWVGGRRGYTLAGLLGGITSSTAVTLTFARQSREDPGAGSHLALGAVGASTVLLIRVLIVALVLHSDLAVRAAPLFFPPVVVGALLLGLGLRHSKDKSADPETDEQNPLRLGSAILMAVGFQIALTGVGLVRQQFGDTGVLPSAALLGLTDMDALTLTMSRLGDGAAMLRLAAQALAIGVISNAVVKIAIALSVGRGEFRTRTSIGLAILGAGSGLGLWLFG
ncbi:MAG: MgtC/SapB family protein [Gemmatimonadota bacterium]